jgi:hypothetical protein
MSQATAIIPHSHPPNIPPLVFVGMLDPKSIWKRIKTVRRQGFSHVPIGHGVYSVGLALPAITDFPALGIATVANEARYSVDHISLTVRELQRARPISGIF